MRTTVDKILITIILLSTIIFQLIAVEDMGPINNSAASTFLGNLGRRICNADESGWATMSTSLHGWG